MHVPRFNRVLGVIILALGALNTVWAMTLPPAAHPPTVGKTLLWLVLLTANGSLYLLGDGLRGRASVRAYLAAQCGLVFAMGATGAQTGVTLAAFAGLTVTAILLLEGRHAVVITIAVIMLFAAASAIGSTLYGGAAAGIVLALVGIVAHAAVALLRMRRPSSAGPEPSALEAPTQLLLTGLNGLTPREQDVLGILARGERTNVIASQLGITERTAKAHLSKIYQKLGVSSRAEAIALVSRERR